MKCSYAPDILKLAGSTVQMHEMNRNIAEPQLDQSGETSLRSITRKPALEHLRSGMGCRVPENEKVMFNGMLQRDIELP